MENLTHSLIGLVAGESLARTTRAHQPGLAPETRRGLFVTLSVIGGNLPDLDLLYSFRLSQSNQAKLTYLLQHRGYTHTIVGCIILGLLLYVATEMWIRAKRIALTPRDHWELAGVASFATSLHLAMDFLNSYGIHPFWPFHNGWVYGDSMFIAEPLYWVATAAPLLFVVRSLGARIVLALAILLGVGVSILAPWVSPLSRTGVLVLTLGLLVVGSRASARSAAIVSASVVLLVTGTFVAAGQVASARAESFAARESPTGLLLDHVLTPMMTNPLCWDLLLLLRNGDHYTALHGKLAIAPSLFPAERCPRSFGDGPGTAPMVTRVSLDPSAILWRGEFNMPVTQLADLVLAHCDAAALMQFVRAPFAAERRQQIMVGDLRFDRERGGGMSTLTLGPPAHGGCRKTVPWDPPRMDLLDPAPAPPR